MSSSTVEPTAAAHGFSGDLLTEEHPSYDEARTTFNAFVDRRPLAIARCRSTADVVVALRVAVLLVRMGGYAIGVFEGERLVASKVGTRFVKGRHKKGGSSSNRFRRRRGEQERELIDAAAAEAARVLGPWRERVEHVALGGDRAAVTRVLESRADLAWLLPLALDRFFDVPEPRLRVLEALPYQLYAAKVVEEPL